MEFEQNGRWTHTPPGLRRAKTGAAPSQYNSDSQTSPIQLALEYTQKLIDEVDRTRREESDDISIVAWNNDPFRTQKDVRRVLARTPERLKEENSQ